MGENRSGTGATSAGDASPPPPLGLDRLVAELVQRAADLVATQRRLQILAEVSQLILSELSLPAVLTQLVHAARDLVDAAFGAIGVFGADGRLEQFLHDGMDGETVARIGNLPQGLGLLGALITDPHPIRLAHIADHPSAVGFPAGHPPMTSFLGVPLLVRGSLYGAIYVADKAGGAEFSDADESILVSLAATAGVAIDNARLYQASVRRELWTQAADETSSALLDAEGDGEPIDQILSTTRRLTNADVVTFVVPADESTWRVAGVDGASATELDGVEYPLQGCYASMVLDRGHGILSASADDRQGHLSHLDRFMDVGPILAVPLNTDPESRGVLTVGRAPASTPFSADDLAAMQEFAGRAAIALELRAARASRRAAVDRERAAGPAPVSGRAVAAPRT